MSGFPSLCPRRRTGSVRFFPSRTPDMKLPFQIGVAGSRFPKPPVKISKAGSHLLIDDCPINFVLSIKKLFC